MVRALLLAATASVAFIVFQVADHFLATTVHVLVNNLATEDIKRARVSACGAPVSGGPIRQGGRGTIDVPVRRDCGLTVEVEFASGRSLSEKEMGYVTPGMSMNVAIDVRDQDIWTSAVTVAD